jgi:hypothetical protein
VDEFLGANAPLVTAEIELPDETTVVEPPDWIGREVTDDHRYKNNNLANDLCLKWRKAGDSPMDDPVWMAKYGGTIPDYTVRGKAGRGD